MGILFVTGVSFWLYTTRVTTNRSFVALYNVNLGVLSNLFFHALQIYSRPILLCVFYYVRSKKKKENHPKKTNNEYPFLRQPSLYFAIVLFRLFISILSLPFFCREFLFILDRSYVLASLN